MRYSGRSRSKVNKPTKAKARRAQGNKSLKVKKVIGALNNATKVLGANGSGQRKQPVQTRRQRIAVRKALGGPPPQSLSLKGLQYAMAALHPCSETATEVVSLPDDSQANRHCTRMQRTHTVGFGSCGDKGDLPCGWNLLVLASPWPEYSHLIYFCEGNEEPISLADYMRDQAGKAWALKNGDTADKLEPKTYYYFAYPNAMAGMSTVKTSGSKLVGKGGEGNEDVCGPDNGDPNDLRDKYTRYRVVAKGMTTYLNASRLSDGGRVICGQYPMAARYTDTFKADKYSLDTKALLEFITKNVKSEMTALAEHTHPIAASGIDHSHEVWTFHPQHELDTYRVRNLTKHEHKVSGDTTESTSYLPPGDRSYNMRASFANKGNFNDQGIGVTPIGFDMELADGSTGSALNVPTGGLLTERTVQANKNIVANMGGSAIGWDHQVPFERGTTMKGVVALSDLGKDVQDAPGDLKVVKDVEEQFIRLKISDVKAGANPDWYVSEPPATENQLFYGDPKATTWEARKGTYQPIRINNLEWQDCQTGYVTPYKLGDRTNTGINPKDYAYSISTNVTGTGTWALAYYRNISTATSVTVKVVQYAEGVVNSSGPFANLSPTNCDPDKAAMDFVAMETRRLQHAYPADYNDLSKILGDIFGVAKNIGSVVKNVAGGLSDVPIVGDLARTVQGILGGLGL